MLLGTYGGCGGVSFAHTPRSVNCVVDFLAKAGVDSHSPSLEFFFSHQHCTFRVGGFFWILIGRMFVVYFSLFSACLLFLFFIGSEYISFILGLRFVLFVFP